jgi:nucleotide-binding universal stress UspA family protein
VIEGWETLQTFVIDSLTSALHKLKRSMYDKILVPTDGGAGTECAVKRAIDFAKTYDAALHTIYVVDTKFNLDSSVPETLEILEETGKRAIDEVIQDAEAAGVDTIEAVVGQGTPYQAIVDYVDEQEIDLVVIGTHGRAGVHRYLLGSVTEKVVRISTAPVLTVPIKIHSDDKSS